MPAAASEARIKSSQPFSEKTPNHPFSL
jgi:hypothetical protein